MGGSAVTVLKEGVEMSTDFPGQPAGRGDTITMVTMPESEPKKGVGILVGIIANDAARFSLFASCVTQLDTTGLDAEIEWLIGGDWCGARNTLARMMLDRSCSHLWFMDDDHAFAPDLLQRLAAHDVAMVNPLCLARIAPFPFVTYTQKVAENQYTIDTDSLPPTGLVELQAGGCAGMLIRRDVLEAIPEPWFEYTDRSEDIVFCEKAKAAGFTIYGDTAARLGHITTAVVYPDLTEDGWMTRLKIGGGLDLFVSPASHWVEEGDPSGGSTPPVEAPPEPPPSDPGSYAERVELWMTEPDLRWHWRALDNEGVILAAGDGVSETSVIATALGFFPLAPVHVIQREIDDSRSPTNYGPPTRLWNRGAE